MIDKEKLEKAICKNVCFTRCPKRLWISCKEKEKGNCNFAKNQENWQVGFATGAEWAEKELSEKLLELEEIKRNQEEKINELQLELENVQAEVHRRDYRQC